MSCQMSPGSGGEKICDTLTEGKRGCRISPALCGRRLTFPSLGQFSLRSLGPKRARDVAI